MSDVKSIEMARIEATRKLMRLQGRTERLERAMRGMARLLVSAVEDQPFCFCCGRNLPECKSLSECETGAFICGDCGEARPGRMSIAAR